MAILDTVTKFGKGLVSMGANAHLMRAQIEALVHLYTDGVGTVVDALPAGSQLGSANIDKEMAQRAAELAVAYVSLLNSAAPSGGTYGEIVSDLAALDSD